jgi:type I restriction enzyme S subunit
MDRRIRRYIRAKQKLIKLLEEQKQVIIHEAVTGQIDVRTGKPYPAYKDSGVEWLGQIPEHWSVRKLKYAVTFSGGGTPAKAESSYWAGSIPWVSPKDMKANAVLDTADHITEEAVASSATNVIPEGAVLMVVRSGILRRYIPVAINAVPVAVNQDMKVLRPNRDLINRYLLALVQGNQAALLTEWSKTGTTVESIEYELLANCRVPLPPLPEQAAIVRYLDDATANTDTAIAHARREIELLREYRTRLIADVVTGKLDVREVAANLRDEAEEPESLTNEDLLADEEEVEEAVAEEACPEELDA